MFQLFSDYWSLIGLPIIGFIVWAKKGRQLDKQEIKIAEIGTKVSEATYTQITQDIYKDLAVDLKADREFLKEENKRIAEESKAERAYFRTQLDEVRKQSSLMQGQLNSITMSYAKEVEVSQNWEKLYSKLNEKYITLDSKYIALEVKYSGMGAEYEQLKKDHDKLKVDFDKYKKMHKPE